METKNIILKLRTERGMSQDELADKIMVTRQAVSRWECGDTVPNTDTLKLLSKEFDVSINTLLGDSYHFWYGSILVRLAAHVSNGLKSRIHPVVGRI